MQRPESGTGPERVAGAEVYACDGRTSGLEFATDVLRPSDDILSCRSQVECIRRRHW